MPWIEIEFSYKSVVGCTNILKFRQIYFAGGWLMSTRQMVAAANLPKETNHIAKLQTKNNVMQKTFGINSHITDVKYI